MEKYLKQVDSCLQHEVPFCTSSCPYGLDVNSMISRIQEGRFNAAYKIYRDAVGFPFIANKICIEKCREACLRNVVSGGDPIELKQLEKAVLKYATRVEATRYNVPKKNKSVAIIGAGISGMACALRLAAKKYDVTIYEKTGRTGGTLTKVIDPETMDRDFELQMEHLDYTIKYNSEITSLEDVIRMGYEEKRTGADKSASAASAVASVMRTSTTNSRAAASGTYDAIYVATGRGGDDFGRPEMIGNTAVFIGGSITCENKADALADGLNMATAIDNFTLTGIHRYPKHVETRIAIDEVRHLTTKTAPPADGAAYSEEESVREAGRCMRCQCNSCRLHCDLTEYVHKWPLRIRDEIIATTAPGKSELHATPAVRLINTCTHCGLCRSTCPENIDMDGLIREARFRMHRLKKMPWAFNDFFLRDMEFTNGTEAYMCRCADGAGSDRSDGKCRYAFFPGCQLGASSPDIVFRAYRYLRETEPDTGIMLGCCGIPADWAGDRELRTQVTGRIRQDWERLGKPVMILACPMCRNTFRKYLPDIETRFIYDVIADNLDKKPLELISGEPAGYSVFDPCATEPGEQVRSSVRKICDKAGIALTPLPIQEKWTACCSYGGHGALADPAFTKFVRDKRINEGELPYITYCINCRDAFLHEGKDAVHILDLVFGTKPYLPTVTERRENRIKLKDMLLREFWRESPISDAQENTFPDSSDAGIFLEIDDDVRRKISEEYILESEAADVVGFCEKTGRTVYDTESDSYTGYRKIGNLTYWVTYRKTSVPDTYRLLNAYTHRMEIELEMVWNGEKVNIDM